MVYLPHWPVPYGKKDIDLGLTRIKSMLDKLGNPERKLPPVIHVAGTNGKGSTIAYLKAMFESAGYKVHRYISPHIVRYNERIMLAGEEINDNFLYEIIEETRLATGDMQPTFFEGTTAAAFLAFSKIKADVLLLETGLGGRLDATNVIPNPMLTVITPISFDHVEYLGTTIAQIASEKAGIIKPNTPCVISWQMQEAMDVLQHRCNELNSQSYAWGKDFDFVKNAEGFSFFDISQKSNVQIPEPGLFGIHQILNAVTAVAAAVQINKLGYTISQIAECKEGGTMPIEIGERRSDDAIFKNGNWYYTLSYDHITQGIKTAKWPARMQQITKGSLCSMLPNGWELWVDGAHNTGGAQMVAATIQSQWNDKVTYIINGRTGGRDIKGFLEYFKDLTPFVCGVKVQSEPRGEQAINIVEGAKETGLEAYECQSITDAIKLILSKANGGGRILVIGSLYLAADLSAVNSA